MKRSRATVAVAAGLALSSCRGCEEEREVPMIAPPPEPSGSAGAPVRAPRPESEALRSLIDHARRADGQRYRAPTDEESTGYGNWLRHIAGAALTDRLPDRPPPAGFLGRLADDGRLWLLTEADDQKRGAGMVILRPGVARPALIEAPHTFFDRGTLELALLLFDRLSARALVLNTMHRSGAATAEERVQEALRGDSENDVAHAKRSFFSTAHESLLRAEPRLLSVQVHGFKDDESLNAHAIVSAAGTTGDARAVGKALQKVLPEGWVRVYPDEIDALGGTQNVQAALSRKAQTRFIHLELSATLRDRLKEDARLAEGFAEALAQVAGQKEP